MLNIIGRFIYDVLKKLSVWIRSVFVSVFALIMICFVFFLILGLIVNSASTSSNLSTVSEKIIQNNNVSDKIALVSLTGVIVSENQNSILSSTDNVITPNLFREVLAKAKSDPQVKAIVFDINSPGGSPVASDRIYEQIVDFKNNTQKPVVFLMGDLVASGAYYIASSADFIVANPSTLTGSIGVIMETYNLEDLYKKIGVSKNTFKQGEYKDILNDSREITDQERKIIDSLNENTYNLFIKRVADGRKMTIEQVKLLANGLIYSGSQAKDNGLIDSLGNMDEAFYQAKSLANIQDYQIVEYNTGSVWNDLFSLVRIPDIYSLIQALPFLPKTYLVQK